MEIYIKNMKSWIYNSLAKNYSISKVILNSSIRKKL